MLWAVPGPPHCLVTLAPTALFALSPATDKQGQLLLLPPGLQSTQMGSDSRGSLPTARWPGHGGAAAARPVSSVPREVPCVSCQVRWVAFLLLSFVLTSSSVPSRAADVTCHMPGLS